MVIFDCQKALLQIVWMGTLVEDVPTNLENDRKRETRNQVDHTKQHHVFWVFEGGEEERVHGCLKRLCELEP